MADDVLVCDPCISFGEVSVEIFCLFFLYGLFVFLRLTSERYFWSTLCRTSTLQTFPLSVYFAFICLAESFFKKKRFYLFDSEKESDHK